LKDTKRATIELVRSGSRKTDILDGLQGLYDVDHFNRMLSLERKRTQRSKKPFILMLLDISKFVNPHPNLMAIRRIDKVLADCVRETDVRGWYRKGAIIGVIFTELASACEAIRDTILGKCLQSLARALDPGDLEKIEITFHVFPEDQDKGNCSGRFDMSLYKDLMENERKNGLPRKLKRFIDVVGSLLALVIFSPVFALIAAAIKLTSEGPVLFRQERVGLWGEHFVFLKFRSMYVKQGENPHKKYIEKLIRTNQSTNGLGNGEETVFKLKDDPRITPIGQFLRKSSLDELPQFINVLRGEMSLVGPRPPIPYEVDIYDTWHRMRLLSVKPGITGLWQVMGRSSTTFDDMVRMDVKYITEWSIWQDIKIILKTPWVVVMGKGAY
jgi:lipopolysaccharide/colanic/teichoic acid biosynthesis glycosyltransferase